MVMAVAYNERTPRAKANSNKKGPHLAPFHAPVMKLYFIDAVDGRDDEPSGWPGA